MDPKTFAHLIRRFVTQGLASERSRQATVTAVTNRDSTGEIEATLADGHTVYIHAATVYDVGVGDIVLVKKLPVGARDRYECVGYHKSSGGSYIPTVRGASGGTVDDILTDDSGNILSDDSFNILTQD